MSDEFTPDALVDATARFREKVSPATGAPESGEPRYNLTNASDRFEQRAHAASRLRYAKELADEKKMEAHLFSITDRSAFWQKEIQRDESPSLLGAPTIFYTKAFNPPLGAATPNNELLSVLNLLYRTGSIRRYDANTLNNTDEFIITYDDGKASAIALRIDAFDRLKDTIARNFTLLAGNSEHPWQCIHEHDGIDFSNVIRIKSPPAKAATHYQKWFSEPLLQSTEELTPLGSIIAASLTRLGLIEGTDFWFSADTPNQLSTTQQAYERSVKKIIARIENSPAR